jgi:hypothetical protein
LENHHRQGPTARLSIDISYNDEGAYCWDASDTVNDECFPEGFSWAGDGVEGGVGKGCFYALCLQNTAK